VARRDPAEARLLGLWTAGWLFALLLAGLVWIGDLRVQWPVLAVPVLWALVALRPRRRTGRHDAGYGSGYGSRYGRHDSRYDDDLAGWPPPDDGPGRLPPTRQLPASRPLPRPPDSRWG
jgi:hypothetical protein